MVNELHGVEQKSPAAAILPPAQTDGVTELPLLARKLKEVFAEQCQELRLLKKACPGIAATQNEISALREA